MAQTEKGAKLYRERNREKLAAYQKAWREKNKDKVKANRDKWAINNPDKITAYRTSERYKELAKTYDRRTYQNRSPEQRKKAILNGVKHNARKRKIEFSLEWDKIEWPEFCPVLGIKLNYKAPTNARNSYDSPSIDRHNPKLGYVPSNIVVMSWRANRIKTDACINELEKLVSYLRRKAIH